MLNPTQIDEFCCELAIELGKTLDEIDELSWSEFLRWQKYFQKKPFSSVRLEFMLAQLTALTYNLNTKDKKSTVEFMISISEDEKVRAKNKIMAQGLLDDL